MIKIPMWILVLIVFNIAVFIIILIPNPNVNLSLFQNNVNNNNPNVVNTTRVQTINQTVTNQSSNKTSNQTSNQTINFIKTNCEIAINDYIKNMENITGFTTFESNFFSKTDDAITYVRNWSSTSYELIGTGKDITVLNKTNKTIISVNDFTLKDGKNFTLPIVCDEKGKLGNYSSCILSNISNMTSYCHYITLTISECDKEKMEHDFWEDIVYWITPKPGALNQSQLFNFTITSSRNRLEYAFLNISYIRPGINKNLFNKSVTSSKGDKITIFTTLNMTGKTFGGVIVEAWFKKKCYKYDILSQYLYG